MLISANSPDRFIGTDFGLIFPQVFFKLVWALDSHDSWSVHRSPVIMVNSLAVAW